MNSFGRVFRLSIYGESHGPTVGILLDGVPPGLSLAAADFEEDLERRRSGWTGTTARREPDLPQFRSGIYQGKTTGAPLLIEFPNSDLRSGDYAALRDTPRPGHADFTAAVKYGRHNDPRGGGHFSGRLTVGLVAAGVVAKKLIQPVRVEAELLEVGGEKDWEAVLAQAVRDGDSLGGVIGCRVEGLSVGLGQPFFDSVESLISHLVFSIPGVRGIEFGSGFAATRMRGSEHNDELISTDGRTATNHAGGINGGITNGNPLEFKVAVKPTPSITHPQRTVNLRSGESVDLKIAGRHDSCIALRVPVVVEAAVAVVLADLLILLLRNAEAGAKRFDREDH